MSHLVRLGSMLTATLVMVLITFQAAQAQNSAANPYHEVEGVWGQIGRDWGATSAVDIARDGSGNIWVAERCGANGCEGHDDVNSVFLLKPSGELVKSFGAGTILQPHGIHADVDGGVWVTDTGRKDGKGYQVHKFNMDGEIVMSIGTPGGTGNGPDSFNGPSDIHVAPSGDIFIAVGHLGRGEDNRITKFSSDGNFIKAWGKTGKGLDEFHDPHALAMDSQGILYVGDRYNNRIQLYDQDGTYIATWTQFGRPSGLYIDGNDILYCADSESNRRRNPGWKRGIRIGGIKDGGWVQVFIPDTELLPDGSGTSGAEGIAAARGSVYGAQVGNRMLRKYVRR